MNFNYTRITYQQMVEDFTARLQNDPRFKNMSSASIYHLFMEMLAATFDMTNYFMQRTSEEAFIDTAKLDSSVIKHGRNLGYNPIRNTPAQADIGVVIRGPLPKALLQTTKATIYFPQEEMQLSYNGKKYILNADYSYTLTRTDIEAGQSSTWTKTLYFSKPVNSVKYIELSGEKLFSDGALAPIKVFQGEVKVDTIYGVSNVNKLGKSYQFYDIDNIKFSNWYGRRDPNGWYKNDFLKKNSWTKVGIGKNQEEAFAEENLYDIEDISIYLNKKVLESHKADETLNVCSLTTNSDKTVRLRFGDGVIVSNGLNTEDQNIYIQYIECDGADANRVGTSDSELKVNNKIWCTYEGSSPVDVTSNIKLIFNGDIANGVDFEDQQAIKNNAPLYFASNNKLVTKQDFVSYFKGLSSPIRVKNAIAWGQDEVEDFDNGGYTTYKYIQNCVCYCIAASVYNTKSTVYSPINVLSDDSGTQTGTFTLYGDSDSYLEHLTDYLKFLRSYNSFSQKQYIENPSEQWLKNIKTIRENAEPKMIMASKMYSFPPIVQYFDVVGNVTINSLSKLQEYKTEVENEIYKWLDNNCNFGTKIYKSDIIKFFNKRSETSFVDLDIRVSDIIKSQNITYTFTKSQAFELSDMLNNTENLALSSNGEIVFDTIKIPKTADSGITLTDESIRSKNMIIKVMNGSDVILDLSIYPKNVESSGDDFVITFYGTSSVKNQVINKGIITLSFSIGNDFYSKSNLSETNAQRYGLTTDPDPNKNTYEQMFKFVSDWIEYSNKIDKANRPIPLPYTITSLNQDTRSETILRKGVLQTTNDKQLTEQAFWSYLIPSIINKFYNIEGEDIDGQVWQNIDNLVIDLYTQLKPTFCDSILDDNNNIINFSMDNELPVVRLNITYSYGK